jgi:predicted membrane protein
MVASSAIGLLWLTASAFCVGVGFTAGCWAWRKVFK